MRRHSLSDYATLILLSAIWGGSFAVIKIAVATVTPLTMVASRVALAALILCVIARLAGQRLPSPRGPEGRALWGHLAAVGMLGNGIPFTLVSWGELAVSSSLAAILIGIMPVFTVVLAYALGMERDRPGARALGIAGGLGGLVVLMGPGALGGLGGGATAHQLAVVAAALSYAANAVYAKRLSLRIPTLTLAAGSMLAAALVMVLAAVMFDSPWRLAPDLAGIAAVAALGILPTALATIIFFRLLVAAGPIFASMINYLIPAFGALAGILWLGESLGVREVAALALILGAIALVRNPPTRGTA